MSSTSAASSSSTAPSVASGEVGTLVVNGNNPATWQQGSPWHDNLGALFTHDGNAETVYSTSTVDTTQSGTTTLDYWAVIPSTHQWLHATRTVIIDEPSAPSIVPDYTASTTIDQAATTSVAQ